MDEKIKNLILKIKLNIRITKVFFLLTIVIFLINCCVFVSSSTTATSEVITSSIDGDLDEYDNNRIFELSHSVLRIGQEINVNNGDVLQLILYDNIYLFEVNDSSKEGIILNGLLNKTVIVETNVSRVVDINNDGEFDLEFRYNFVEDNYILLVKEYYRNYSIKGNYSELFDVIVSVVNGRVDRNSFLTVSFTFYNFGEGPSLINISYLIKNESGNEMYRGIDQKVVYTEESFIKTFDFLNLVPGDYTISTEILYGENQTATSGERFKVYEDLNDNNDFVLIIFFFGAIVLIFVFILIKNRINKREDVRNNIVPNIK
ncbi:hypothetical protein GOV12_06635 [Candidatus Pacearchaeota archaeon]|nr:hypothetical protein [Candidatus Pacearchaeota archaeon]